MMKTRDLKNHFHCSNCKKLPNKRK